MAAEVIKSVYRGIDIYYDKDSNKWRLSGIDERFISLKKATEYLDAELKDKFKKFYLLNESGDRKLVTDRKGMLYYIDGTFRNFGERYHRWYKDTKKNRDHFMTIDRLKSQIAALELKIKAERNKLEEFVPDQE